MVWVVRVLGVVLFCSFAVPAIAGEEPVRQGPAEEIDLSESTEIDIHQTFKDARSAAADEGEEGKRPILSPAGMRDVGIGLVITGSVLTPVAIASAVNSTESEADLDEEMAAEATRNNTIGIALGGTLIAAGVLLAVTGAKRVKSSQAEQSTAPEAARYEPSQRRRVQWALCFEGASTPACP
ncbi:MAG: hypothetical protein VX498_06675 [Myxococcota bacterium]|nr:hypothetical protein [Myxococcota bacterium]